LAIVLRSFFFFSFSFCLHLAIDPGAATTTSLATNFSNISFDDNSKLLPSEEPSKRHHHLSVLFPLEQLVKEILDNTTFTWKELPQYEGMFSCSPKKPDVPDLLLHDLDSKLSASPVENGDCVVFGLSSGTGKTRTLYEYASKTLSFYFVVDPHGNGGSADFRSFVSQCHAHPTEVDSLADQLLGSRNVVWDFISSKLRCNPTPKQWLLIQLYPTYFFRLKDNEVDLFHVLFQKCEKVAISQSIIIDEAQSLVHIDLRNPFTQSNKYQDAPRPILTAIVRAFPDNITMLIAGTSTTMSGVIEFLSSHRPTARSVEALKLYDTADDAWSNYVSKFLPEGAKDLFAANIFQSVKGRPRFLQFFCEFYLLSKKESVEGKLEDARDLMFARFSQYATESVKKSVGDLHLAGIMKKFHFSNEPLVVTAAADAVVRAGLTPIRLGENDVGYSIFETPVIELLTDIALSPEYLLQEIATGGTSSSKGFDLENYLFFCFSKMVGEISLMDILDFHSHLWYENNSFMVNRAEKLARELRITLSTPEKIELPTLRQLLAAEYSKGIWSRSKNMIDGLKAQISLLEQKEEYSKKEGLWNEKISSLKRPLGSPMVANYTKSAEMLDFPKSTFNFAKPDKYVGPDVVGKMKFGGEVYLVSAQAKLYTTSKPNLQDATSKSAPFHDRDDMKNQFLQAMKGNQSGLLRLVVVATPKSVGESLPHTRRIEVTGEEVTLFLSAAAVMKMSPSEVAFRNAWRQLTGEDSLV